MPLEPYETKDISQEMPALLREVEHSGHRIVKIDGWLQCVRCMRRTRASNWKSWVEAKIKCRGSQRVGQIGIFANHGIAREDQFQRMQNRSWQIRNHPANKMSVCARRKAITEQMKELSRRRLRDDAVRQAACKRAASFFPSSIWKTWRKLTPPRVSKSTNLTRLFCAVVSQAASCAVG